VSPPRWLRFACSLTPASFLAQALQLVSKPPLLHRHRRPAAHLGVDGEFVDEPTSPRQAEAEASLGGESVADCRLDVADARPGVAGDDQEPIPVVFVQIGRASCRERV